MQALIDEILHCIIHKPMTGDTAFAGKRRAGNTHPKVRAKALRIGACMAGVGGAFIKHFKPGRGQLRLQLLFNMGSMNRQRRVVGG